MAPGPGRSSRRLPAQGAHLLSAVFSLGALGGFWSGTLLITGAARDAGVQACGASFPAAGRPCSSGGVGRPWPAPSLCSAIVHLLLGTVRSDPFPVSHLVALLTTRLRLVPFVVFRCWRLNTGCSTEPHPQTSLFSI